METLCYSLLDYPQPAECKTSKWLGQYGIGENEIRMGLCIDAHYLTEISLVETSVLTGLRDRVILNLVYYKDTFL